MINLFPATNFLPWKCQLLFTSAADTQVQFRLDFNMEANNMKPDQTVPLSILIWVYIVCNIGQLRK